MGLNLNQISVIGYSRPIKQIRMSICNKKKHIPFVAIKI